MKNKKMFSSFSFSSSFPLNFIRGKYSCGIHRYIFFLLESKTERYNRVSTQRRRRRRLGFQSGIVDVTLFERVDLTPITQAAIATKATGQYIRIRCVCAYTPRKTKRVPRRICNKDSGSDACCETANETRRPALYPLPLNSILKLAVTPAYPKMLETFTPKSI